MLSVISCSIWVVSFNWIGIRWPNRMREWTIGMCALASSLAIFYARRIEFAMKYVLYMWMWMRGAGQPSEFSGSNDPHLILTIQRRQNHFLFWNERLIDNTALSLNRIFPRILIVTGVMQFIFTIEIDTIDWYNTNITALRLFVDP